jgi:hypothetical protein
LEENGAAVIAFEEKKIDTENLGITLKQQADAIDVSDGVEELLQGSVDEPPRLVEDDAHLGGIDNAVDRRDIDDVEGVSHESPWNSGAEKIYWRESIIFPEKHRWACFWLASR